jgi:fatty-acyl-CoA synthase
MPMAPMFHGNAWQFPYIAPMNGYKLVLPGRNYEPELLYELLDGEKVTVTCGVPTLWLILTDWLERTGKKLSTLRLTLSSGSAVPRSLVEKLERDYGVETAQAWGMTEILGGSNVLLRPGTTELPFAERIDRRLKSGRTLAGNKYRLVDDDGRLLPHDGVSVGHLRVKAPWAASGYLKGEGGSALDEDGWLKTGDMATIDREGHIVLTDRSKDVIKSGGEWISSLELENVALGHPDVLQAAVIGVPHPRWQERPLLVVVPREGSPLEGKAVLDFMRGKIASWWMPDDVVVVAQLPMTGTGKVHKATLREQFKTYVPGEPPASRQD